MGIIEGARGRCARRVVDIDMGEDLPDTSGELSERIFE